MPVQSIPETKESLRNCPSLYTIIQFLLSATALAVQLYSFSSTLWIETFLDSGQSQYRYLSVGLWRVCYYQNYSRPGTATECITVKFNGRSFQVLSNYQLLNNIL